MTRELFQSSAYDRLDEARLAGESRVDMDARTKKRP